jgi:hypothetical protein
VVQRLNTISTTGPMGHALTGSARGDGDAVTDEVRGWLMVLSSPLLSPRYLLYRRC